MKEKYPKFFSHYEALVNEEYPETDEYYGEVEDKATFDVCGKLLEGDALQDDDEDVERDTREKEVERRRSALAKGEDSEIVISGGRWKEDKMGGYFCWDDSTITVTKKRKQVEKKNNQDPSG